MRNVGNLQMLSRIVILTLLAMSSASSVVHAEQVRLALATPSDLVADDQDAGQGTLVVPAWNGLVRLVPKVINRVPKPRLPWSSAPVVHSTPPKAPPVTSPPPTAPQPKMAPQLKNTAPAHVPEAPAGRKPVNSQYANQDYPLAKLPPELQKKYPNSVRFDKDGYPEFSPYALKRVRVDGLTGNHADDVAKANKAAGYDRTPDGYTWHHHQDGKTMELVPTDLHQAVRHSGGAAKLRQQAADAVQ